MAVGSRLVLCSLLACFLTSLAFGRQVNASDPQGGNISGTVMDSGDNVISGATVVLEDATMEPNYSAIGGDLAAGAVSNLYYPARNRGGGLILQNSAITAGARVVDGLLEEFVLRRFTTRSR